RRSQASRGRRSRRGTMTAAAQPPLLVVHKFGGAALSDAGSIRRAADIVSAHRGAGGAGARPSVVVTSALAGVTDALIAAGAHAAGGDAAALEHDIESLRERHQ